MSVVEETNHCYAVRYGITSGREEEIETRQDKVTRKKEGPTPDRRPGYDPDVQEATVGAMHYPLAICCCVRFGRPPDWPGLSQQGNGGGASKPGSRGV